MKHLIRLFIYGNSACAQRRPTIPEDYDDYYEEDVEVETPEELLKACYEKVFDYEDEDLEDMTTEAKSLEDAISEFDSNQDYGDGSSILYACYDLTDNKWLLGDAGSKAEWLTEYCEPEDYEDEGLDFDAISKMDIKK